eukprot:7647777-Alexandrium_andersonii.AAC.1
MPIVSPAIPKDSSSRSDSWRVPANLRGKQRSPSNAGPRRPRARARATRRATGPRSGAKVPKPSRNGDEGSEGDNLELAQMSEKTLETGAVGEAQR